MIGQSNEQLANDTSWSDGTREHLLVICGSEATDREYARVVAAQPYPWSQEEMQAAQEENMSSPFQLMR